MPNRSIYLETFPRVLIFITSWSLRFPRQLIFWQRTLFYRTVVDCGEVVQTEFHWSAWRSGQPMWSGGNDHTYSTLRMRAHWGHV